MLAQEVVALGYREYPFSLLVYNSIETRRTNIAIVGGARNAERSLTWERSWTEGNILLHVRARPAGFHRGSG